MEMYKNKDDFTLEELGKLDIRFCHLCGQEEDNKWCTNKSCYEYQRHEPKD